MRIEARTRMERDTLDWIGTLPLFEDYDAERLAHDFGETIEVAQAVVDVIESDARYGIRRGQVSRKNECEALQIPETNAGAWIAQYIWGYIGDDSVVIRCRKDGTVNPASAAYCDRIIEQFRACPAFDAAIEAEEQEGIEAARRMSRALHGGATFGDAMAAGLGIETE